jgi:tetrahydromethanopterin S-methyltransferase subunit A
MDAPDLIGQTQAELQAGMALAKCRKCGCMQETLVGIQTSLPSLGSTTAAEIATQAERWLSQMEPVQYACLGCTHCFPAVAMNSWNAALPDGAPAPLACGFEVQPQVWPAVPGEYVALCTGTECSVAVSTLGSVDLPAQLASMPPAGLCIVGKTETENIGIDKLIKNIVTNPTIRVLLLVGQETHGHNTGQTLLALAAHGVDERMRVIGSSGKRPMLRNVTCADVAAFRQQVQVVDMIGCVDAAQIAERVRELAQTATPACTCETGAEHTIPVQLAAVETIQATEPARVVLDKAGYFVIMVQPERGIIIVEQYAYDNQLLRVIEGTTARSIYWTLIDHGWVTLLSHAAYLGKELAKAELSAALGYHYVQDGA